MSSKTSIIEFDFMRQSHRFNFISFCYVDDISQEDALLINRFIIVIDIINAIRF